MAIEWSKDEYAAAVAMEDGEEATTKEEALAVAAMLWGEAPPAERVWEEDEGLWSMPIPVAMEEELLRDGSVEWTQDDLGIAIEMP
jgi:hypothetical protein